MSLEDKFNAAVNVIRSLPKSGSYQPSNELMLRFYSYFKQATEGPCDKPKPGFWDVVNRAKWESWNKLGNMTKDEAMKAYVDELHKIVETMSYNSDVASFLSVDDEDPNFPNNDLELVAGDVLARVRSGQNTPVLSGASSPVRSASPPRQRHDSDDEFIDTVDVSVSEPEAPPPRQTAPRLSNGHAHQITSQLTHLKVLEQLPGTLARLEADVAALRKAVEGDRRILDQVQRGWRWPWQELSWGTLALVLLWPVVAHRLLQARSRRHT
ncbi:acyl-CoA-binding domain-containing protein 5 isoform X5 [Helicoverpa armigera]|uniref:acyl-CoA-binding domain-containing protein 5 isoform X2 n=1 Tax=Helicoverpa zea TaxID=7113 RepID=UPI000B37218C|nr:acyl-CoA-binding domain-containing protein 5 isoform X5 [Helicoverpa armigera]XP_047038080.1 acyl-CoA-binding domain-containing protein 5 isoform X2 [Helicoverpa zea]